MPKRIFWPATLVTMGLILIASQMGYLPPEFIDLWPVMLIVVGLGGLLTSDREEWVSKARGGSGATMAAKSMKSSKTPAKKAKSRR